MNKEVIPGAILIYSCHKHIKNRLNNSLFGLRNKEYNRWRVFYFIGDPTLSTSFEIKENIITLKCEDSYIHVMKKVVMGIQVIFELYDIVEGILRCGDDLIFNENNLIKFIKRKDKKDYMGKIANPYMNNNVKKKIDQFMPNYYLSHEKDLEDPMNGLLNKSMDDMMKYNEVPNVKYTGGVIFYLSKLSCNHLISTLKSINWDIFKYYSEYGYPYIIEDIGIGFILNIYRILPVMCDLYSDYEIKFENTDYIGCHTNHEK